MVECDWVVVKVWLFQTCNFTFCECGAEWRWAGSSEIEVLLVKVKVVTVPNVCSLGEPVDWFSSAILSYWDLARVKSHPTLPFLSTGSGLAVGQRGGSLVSVGRLFGLRAVYESHQTLIGSQLYCRLAFRQQFSHILSSYSSSVPAKGKVEPRNQR